MSFTKRVVLVHYIEQIKDTQYCNIIFWVHINYKHKENREIVSPTIINEVEYDYIVVAVYENGANESIMNYLRLIRVVEDKIITAFYR